MMNVQHTIGGVFEAQGMLQRKRTQTENSQINKMLYYKWAVSPVHQKLKINEKICLSNFRSFAQYPGKH